MRRAPSASGDDDCSCVDGEEGAETNEAEAEEAEAGAEEGRAVEADPKIDDDSTRKTAAATASLPTEAWRWCVFILTMPRRRRNEGGCRRK